MTIQVQTSASGCFVSFMVRNIDPAVPELVVFEAPSPSKGGRAKQPTVRRGRS
jgi:hypothetical protein